MRGELRTVMLSTLTFSKHDKSKIMHTSCVVDGPYRAPCWKILHFKFNGTYDSHSCYNFAVGIPYGKPPVTGNQLCLNGIDQFLKVSF